MRGTATFENVIGKVHEMSENNFDEVVQVQDMEFDSLNQMWIAGKPIEVLPSAQRLLANRLRVPFSYLSRCPADLQAQNLNYWIEQERKSRETLFWRFAANNKLRAAFTQRYTALDHLEVLSRMLEYGFGPASEVHYSLDESLMVLKMPEYNRGFNLTGNDKIVPGISIANSEVGILALSIEAYFYRLVCSNGMISKTAVASRFKHVSRKALDEFPQVLSHVVYESEKSQNRFGISIDTSVDSPMETISTFSRQFGLSQNEAQLVEKAFYLEEGATMFHIINAFTRAAQEPSLATAEAYKLERTGGQILGLIKQ